MLWLLTIAKSAILWSQFTEPVREALMFVRAITAMAAILGLFSIATSQRALALGTANDHSRPDLSRFQGQRRDHQHAWEELVERAYVLSRHQNEGQEILSR